MCRHLFLWGVIYPDPGLMLLWLIYSWEFPTISAVEHIFIHSLGYFSRASFQTWLFGATKFWTRYQHVSHICQSSPHLSGISDCVPSLLLPSRFPWKASSLVYSVTTSRPETRRTVGWLTIPLFSVALSNVISGLTAFPRHHTNLLEQLFLSTS